MNVRGTVAVTFLRADQIADGTIHRNHVTERAKTAEVITSFGIRMKTPAQIHLRWIVLLQIVVACLVRFPNLDKSIGNTLAGRVRYASVEGNLSPFAFRNDRIA